jgi:hypothetical protein
VSIYSSILYVLCGVFVVLVCASRPGSASDSREQAPLPLLTHLEGRTVQASFLQGFQREKVTQSVKGRATHAAIPYLRAALMAIQCM